MLKWRALSHLHLEEYGEGCNSRDLMFTKIIIFLLSYLEDLFNF